MRELRNKITNTSHIALACSKDQFLTQCKGWEINPNRITYAIANEPSDLFKEAIRGIHIYTLIILSDWNKKEYKEEEFYTALIRDAAIVASAPSCVPYRENGVITGWSENIEKTSVNRSRYFLPYISQSKRGIEIWTAEHDQFLTNNYSKLSLAAIAREVGCNTITVINRANQLHLKEKLGIEFKKVKRTEGYN